MPPNETSKSRGTKVVPAKNAARLAAELHAGQVDKAGKPYIDHLIRVVLILQRRFPDATDAEIEAAWLHDAIEDTAATAESLLAAGVSQEAVDIVTLLTKPDGAVYLEWIGELVKTGNASAIRVKLADNEDNQAPARVAALPGAEQMVATRYAPARKLLLAGLSEL